MRILSQTGIVDLPYESIGISRNNTEIVATPIADSNPQERYWALAEYSTEAKARKAMEMLREEYAGMPSIRRMDDLYGRFKHTGKKDFELFIEHMVLKKCYFQFPADDEVEV